MARIIYVEDDDLVGSLVQQVLTDAGHLVGVINHGTLALDTIVQKIRARDIDTASFIQCVNEALEQNSFDNLRR